MDENAEANWVLVDYANLDIRQQESHNFHKLAAVLADYGFDCFRIPNDYKGADFFAHHVPSGRMLRVQLKSALTVSKKYEHQHGLWVAFPIDGEWHLAPHSDLVEIVGRTTPALGNRSYASGRDVFWRQPTRALRDAIVRFRMEAKRG